jgi:hypothetical protein
MFLARQKAGIPNNNVNGTLSFDTWDADLKATVGLQLPVDPSPFLCVRYRFISSKPTINSLPSAGHAINSVQLQVLCTVHSPYNITAVIISLFNPKLKKDPKLFVALVFSRPFFYPFAWSHAYLRVLGKSGP